MERIIVTFCLWMFVCGQAPSWGRKPYLPDPVATPGALLPEASEADVCGARPLRGGEPSAEIEKEVFEAYGIVNPKPGEWKIDALIPVELGGDPASLSNLFPLRYNENAGGWDLGANTKRLAELAVLKELCHPESPGRPKITLNEAREQFANNWPVLYRQFVDKELPPFYEPDLNNFPKWKP
jgi:hypothetical protein